MQDCQRRVGLIVSAEIIEDPLERREQHEPRTSEYILQHVFESSDAGSCIEQLCRNEGEPATRRLLALILSVYEVDSVGTESGFEDQLIKKIVQQCVVDDGEEAIQRMLDQEGLGQVAPSHVIVEAAAKNIAERLHSWMRPVMQRGGVPHDAQEIFDRMSWLYLRMAEQIDFSKDELTFQLLRLYSRPAGSDREDHQMRVRFLQMHFSAAAHGPRTFVDIAPLREALEAIRRAYGQRCETLPRVVATDEDLLMRALLGGDETQSETPQSFLEIAGRLGLNEQEMAVVRADLLIRVQALLAIPKRRGRPRKHPVASDATAKPKGRAQKTTISTAKAGPDAQAVRGVDPEAELFEEDDQEREDESVNENSRDEFDQLKTEAVPDRDLVRTYLKEVSRWKLLKAEDEVLLSKEIEAGLFAQELLDGGSHGVLEGDGSLHEYFIDPVTGELYPQARQELQELARIGKAAKERMINSNLRLVISVAKRYQGRGMQFLDIIQEGNLGLIRALEKFDYTKGYKFSTYATWWIKQSIARGMADKARTIRLPVHVMDQLSRVLSAKKAFIADNHREPTDEELAVEVDMPTNKITELRNHARLPIALETPLSDDGTTEFGDLVEDSHAPEALIGAENSLLRGMFEEILFLLSEREADIIRMRFGFDGEPCSLDKIAQAYGLTREGIRRIEKKALLKMRGPSREAGLEKWGD